MECAWSAIRDHLQVGPAELGWNRAADVARADAKRADLGQPVDHRGREHAAQPRVLEVEHLQLWEGPRGQRAFHVQVLEVEVAQLVLEQRELRGQAAGQQGGAQPEHGGARARVRVQAELADLHVEGRTMSDAGTGGQHRHTLGTAEAGATKGPPSRERRAASGQCLATRRPGERGSCGASKTATLTLTLSLILTLILTLTLTLTLALTLTLTLSLILTLNPKP